MTDVIWVFTAIPFIPFMISGVLGFYFESVDIIGLGGLGLWVLLSPIAYWIHTKGKK